VIAGWLAAEGTEQEDPHSADGSATRLTVRGEDVAHEVDSAPLPGGADQHRGDRGLQPGVGVADHQLDPAQAAGLQAAQERGPERPVLAVADPVLSSNPRTSRRPSAVTPVAITTAWDTTRRLTRALQ